MIFHTWYLYIIFFLIFHTAFTLLFRTISKNNPHHYKVIISTVFVFLWLSGMIFSLVTGHIDFRNVIKVLPYLIVGGIIFAYANVYGSKAMGRIDAAQHTILSILRVVITVIASSILLNEGLSNIQILGTILILSAVLISTFRLTRRSFNVDHYSLIAILSSILIGVAITNEKYILNYMNIQTYLIVGWGFQTISLLLITFKELKNIQFFVKNKIFSKLVFLGILRGLSGIAFVSSLISSNNSSLTSISSSFIVICVTIAAIIFLNEKDHIKKKIISAILATVGFIIIGLK